MLMLYLRTMRVMREIFGSKKRLTMMYAPNVGHRMLVKMYGGKRLRLCSCFDLCLLNGMREGDSSGNYTYISSLGNNVIDYFIFSRSLSRLQLQMCVYDRIDSKHMPIACFVRCQKRIDIDNLAKTNIPVYKAQ